MLESKDVVSNPSFTKAFWAAKTIRPFDDWERKYLTRIGYTYHHRVPRPFDPEMRYYRSLDDMLKHMVLEEMHTTQVWLQTHLDPRLYRIYLLDNELGGKADPDWAWRPGIWWTFCEKCETLWTMPFEKDTPPTITDIFPLNYLPEKCILIAIRNWCEIMWDDYYHADLIRRVLHPTWM